MSLPDGGPEVLSPAAPSRPTPRATDGRLLRRICKSFKFDYLGL